MPGTGRWKVQGRLIYRIEGGMSLGMKKRAVMCLALCFLLSTGWMGAEELKVSLAQVPNEGIQPKVLRGADGTIHLLYYSGDEAAGDLLYVRKPQDGVFSTPIQVNNVRGSALSIGTIRGAQMSLGRNDRVHVVWNGASKKDKSFRHGPPMYYARMKQGGLGFEDQVPISKNWIMDGGGAVAADHEGRVYVFWHAAEEGADESRRRIFMRVSMDEGAGFSDEKVISSMDTGVCGCCGMQALATSAGEIHVVYRAARDQVHRDVMLLSSKGPEEQFSSQTLDQWRVETCPMSSMSLLETSKGTLAAWETRGQIGWARIDQGTFKIEPLASPAGESKERKHPSIAVGAEDRVLLSWAEGTGWKRGGSVAWRSFDAEGNPLELNGLKDGVKVWSFPAGYWDEVAGEFKILY